MLPGLSGIGNIPADAAASWSFVGESSATGANNVTPHANAAVGDVAICFAHKTSSGTTSNNAPSGWTEIAKVSGTYGYCFFWKELESGDLGTGVDTAGTASFQGGKTMLVFRPTGISSPSITENIGSNPISHGDPASETITASNQSAPCVVIGFAGARTNTTGGSLDITWTTESPAFDATYEDTNTNPVSSLGYKIYNSGSVSDHDIDMGDAGWGNVLGGCVLI